MTRIIQRCLLVLAFTGVLLSSSQETTVSDVSDPTAKSSEQTSPSAPESSSYSVEKYSSYSPIDKTEDHSPSTSAVSSSKQETSVASTALNNVDNDIVSENSNSKDGTTAAVVLESTTKSVVDATDADNNADRSTTVQSTTFVSATEETLARVELQEAEPKGNLIYNKTLEKTLNSSDKDVNRSANSPNSMHEQDVSDVGLSDISSQPTTSTGVNETPSATTIVSELKETTVTAISNPAEMNSSDNITSDYGQSSVPSVEESVYNTSYVDNYHTSEKMFSTTPSKVQTVDSKASDLPKSATRKRSLNATNTASSNVSSVSTMHVTTPLSPSEFSTQVTEILPGESINKNSEAILETGMKVQLSSTVLPSTDFVTKKRETVTHPEETGESSSPYTVNNIVQNVNDNAAQNGKDGLDQHVPKTSSASSLDVTHMSSTSSIALSTANGESIHSLETTIDHVSHLGISSMPPGTVRTHEKLIEREDEFPTISSDSPLKHSSPVTFDPNGMTHNYTQDPDSITFTPETFYVDGMPANGYLSRLDENEFTSNKPVVDLQHAKLEESTTPNDKLLGSSSSELEINTPEREREYVSPSGINLSPHDEPDLEEMSDRHTLQNTKKETDNQFSKDGSLQTQTGIPVQTKKPPTHPPNDESEEMLNDSPYFDQSNFASASGTEVKSEEIAHALNKALEMNVSNDISPSTGSNSQNTPETANELEFPVDYQTAQSEIRPVTVVSPLQTSDSTIFSPVPIKVETHLPPEVTKSEQSDTTLPNTSSPIILPNPAPSIADIRAKATTIELPPHLLPPGYVHEPKKENENVAPKTSSINVSNLRPKVTAVEMPSHLLPPGYTPEPENGSGSSKDSPIGISSLRPKATAIEIASHLLPPGYKPEPETETENESSKNSTIAGVAVKTSVSVSLPLSKGTNSSMSSKEDKTYDSSEGGENSSALPVPINVPGGSPSISASTETPAGSTTQARGIKIRKPKIRIGGTDEPETPRTRKPFLSSFQRPSTTAGPPVSIFNKARTRSNSITSSTTAKPFPQFSTMLIHYASRMPGMMPNGELGFSFEPTTEVPTTTETEEPFSDEPFNEPTQVPVVSSEDDVTLIRVAGYIVVEKGLKWISQLNVRHSPQYKERANFVHLQLERLFRSSPIAPSLWKIQIDGFSGVKDTRFVAVDFFLYLIKSKKDISAEQLVTVFHDKLKNNTFSRFTVDTSKTSFEVVNEEPLKTTTPPPEKERETFLPQWAIAVIVVGAASLIFIILFAAVAILGRHHMRRRYSNKLNDEDSDRPSDWESKMAAAYENLAADTIYDADDLHGDSYKKKNNSTFHGRPSRARRADSWSSCDWSPPPRRHRPQVHRIVY